MFAKRIFDLIIVALALPLWLPAMILVALVVRVYMGSPVLFIQERPGFKGRLFKLYKFRTMHGNEDIPDHERLPNCGRKLRATSLDELPEILNIIKGDMSLVGPRPLLKEYLPLYSPVQNRRHEALPGITGWAQIHGRNLVEWGERFALDVWYVDNRSLWLDVKILFKTLAVVFSGSGVSGSDHVTMSRFTGNQKENQ